jgi:hypothetical protein
MCVMFVYSVLVSSKVLLPSDSGHITICCPEWSDIKYTWMSLPFLSEYGQSDCGFSHLGMSKYVYECRDAGTLYFWQWDFSVAKFTTLIPLAHLIFCKLSFSIVGLKMSSLPTLTEFSCVIWWIYWTQVPIPHRSWPSCHRFYPLFGHERSEQWCEPVNSVLYMRSCY